MLLIEQNVHFAATVADRHYLLAEGRIVESLDNDRGPRTRARAARVPRNLTTAMIVDMRRCTMRVTGWSGCWPPRSCCWPAAAAADPAAAAAKISDDKVVLAVLNDQSGVYSRPVRARTRVEAVQMAVADYKAKYGDKAVAKKIEVMSADHQNKPDIANTKAQELYDRQQADVILDVPTSSAALAVATVAKDKKKLFIDIGAATHRADRQAVQQVHLPLRLQHATCWPTAPAPTVTKDGAQELVHRLPGLRVRPGHEEDLHARRSRRPAAPWSRRPDAVPERQLLHVPAQGADLDPKPQVLGTMQAGGDLVNLVKQYNEYKLRDKGVGLAVGLMFLTDIHSLGPDALAGTTFTDAWYWNFDAHEPGLGRQVPGQDRQAPHVRARRQLLGRAAVPGGGAARPAPTTPTRSSSSSRATRSTTSSRATATIRAQDHLLLHDAYLAQVKPASEVKEPWDYEKIVKTIPAAEAFQPRPTRPASCRRLGVLQQAFNGLVGGAFYALLALGLAVIFGMLGVVNFAHGAFYMLGAFGAYVAAGLLRAELLGRRWCWCRSLLGLLGVVLERLFIRRLTPLDPLYNFLFTFGLALDPAGPGEAGVRRAVPARTRGRRS